VSEIITRQATELQAAVSEVLQMKLQRAGLERDIRGRFNAGIDHHVLLATSGEKCFFRSRHDILTVQAVDVARKGADSYLFRQLQAKMPYVGKVIGIDQTKLKYEDLDTVIDVIRSRGNEAPSLTRERIRFEVENNIAKR
jgi:hypothetical protein